MDERRLWRVWRAACVVLGSAAAAGAAGALAAGALASLAAEPAARSASPDGRFELRVFTAGQGAIPPDYRAGVRFYLYDGAAWPLFRYTEVASAAFADGWSAEWAGPREAVIRAGRLSWFDAAKAEAGGVAVRLLVADRTPEEARCIEQSFSDAADGVVCFDALVRAGAPPR